MLGAAGAGVLVRCLCEQHALRLERFAAHRQLADVPGPWVQRAQVALTVPAALSVV